MWSAAVSVSAPPSLIHQTGVAIFNQPRCPILLHQHLVNQLISPIVQPGIPVTDVLRDQLVQGAVAAATDIVSADAGQSAGYVIFQ